MSERINLQGMRPSGDPRAVKYDDRVVLKAGELHALVEAVETARRCVFWHGPESPDEYSYGNELWREALEAFSRFDFGDGR